MNKVGPTTFAQPITDAVNFTLLFKTTWVGLILLIKTQNNKFKHASCVSRHENIFVLPVNHSGSVVYCLLRTGTS